MQKVVGSNPISRSSTQMANSKRKGADRKTGRTAGRGSLRRRGRHGDDDAAEGSPEPQKTPGRTEGGKGEMEDGQTDSSLLASTTQASEEVKQLLAAAGDASKQIREAARTGEGGESRVEGNEPAAMISKINSEVRTVLEAADEAAEKIREEAQSDARRLIDENRRRAESVTREHLQRVSEMTEEVLSQLGNVQGQLDTLRRAFDQSIQRLGTDLHVEVSSEVWSTAQNGADEEGDSDDLRQRLGRRAKPKAAEPEEISEGARLLALQQLNAGVDAAVIEKRLIEQFGVKDPKPILKWIGVQAEPPSESKKR